MNIKFVNVTRMLLKLTIAILPGLTARAADTVPTHTDSGLTNSGSTSQVQLYHRYSNNYVGRFGAGITLGEPIGADVKYWLNRTMAIDGALGWSCHEDTDLYLHSDFLWHHFHLIRVPSGRMPLYYGVGALARFRHGGYDNQVGVRVPVGVSYMFDNAPVDIFAEFAPALDIAPSVRGEVTGGIGIRYWF